MGVELFDFIIIAILAPLCAFIGISIFKCIQDRYHFSSKSVLCYCLVIYTLIPAWGIVGFSGKIGYIYSLELYVVIAIYGAHLAIYESTSRIAFIDLVPPGQESEFFGLYSISDKGSSWLGPMVVGLCFQYAGTARWAFIYLSGTCAIAFITIYWFVDFEKGAQNNRRKETLLKMEAVRKRWGVSKADVLSSLARSKSHLSSVTNGHKSSTNGSLKSESKSSIELSLNSKSSVDDVVIGRDK